MRILALVALAGLLGAAALPPQAESLRPAIQAAERRLQDASLQLEAAKHAAQPLEAQVAEARQGGGTWWGSWIYKRRLGRLKTSLDAVEAARAAQAAAHQELSLLLTGADEELSTALEASLGAVKSPQPGDLAAWRLWWQQKKAWQQRLGSLEPSGGTALEEAGTGAGSARIQAELRQSQWERERGLLESMHRSGALSKAEWRTEQERLLAGHKK